MKKVISFFSCLFVITFANAQVFPDDYTGTYEGWLRSEQDAGDSVHVVLEVLPDGSSGWTEKLTYHRGADSVRVEEVRWQLDTTDPTLKRYIREMDGNAHTALLIGNRLHSEIAYCDMFRGNYTVVRETVLDCEAVTFVISEFPQEGGTASLRRGRDNNWRSATHPEATLRQTRLSKLK